MSDKKTKPFLKITLKNIASFIKQSSVELKEPVNLVYGSNGSGKTTLSRFLHVLSSNSKFTTPDYNYDECKLECYIGFKNPKIFVFNSEYINNNFIQKDNIEIITFENKNAFQQLDIFNKNWNHFLNELQDINKNLFEHLNEQTIFFPKNSKITYQYLRQLINWRQKISFQLIDNIFNKSILPKLFSKNLDKVISKKSINSFWDLNNKQFPQLNNDIMNKLLFDSNEEKLKKLTWKKQNTENINKLKNPKLKKLNLNDTNLNQLFRDSEWRKIFKNILSADKLQKGDCPICGTKNIITKQKITFLQKHLKTFEDQIKNNTAQKNIINSLIKLKNNITDNLEILISTTETTNNLGLENNIYYLLQTQKLLYTEISKLYNSISVTGEIANNFNTGQIEKQIIQFNKSIEPFLCRTQTQQKSNIVEYLHTQQNVKIVSLILNMNSKIEKLQTILRNYLKIKITKTKAAKKINNLLKEYEFNFSLTLSKDLQPQKYIVVSEWNKQPITPKNLSEGEKTIISLFYFFINLNKEMNENPHKSNLIIIDDPVSSLSFMNLSNIARFLKTQMKFTDIYFKKNKWLILSHNAKYLEKMVYHLSNKNHAIFELLVKTHPTENKFQLRNISFLSTIHDNLWKGLFQNINAKNHTTTCNIIRRIQEHLETNVMAHMFNNEYYKNILNDESHATGDEINNKNSTICKNLIYNFQKDLKIFLPRIWKNKKSKSQTSN